MVHIFLMSFSVIFYLFRREFLFRSQVFAEIILLCQAISGPDGWNCTVAAINGIQTDKMMKPDLNGRELIIFGERVPGDLLFHAYDCEIVLRRQFV